MGELLTPSSGNMSGEIGEPLDDPYPLLSKLRRQTRVLEGDMMALFGLSSVSDGRGGDRPVFTLLRYDDVTRAIRDPETFSTSLFCPEFGPGVILYMDGEEHRRWRGLLMPVFAGRGIEHWEETVIRPVARRLVEAREADRRADLMSFALDFSVRMVYEIVGFDEATGGWEEWAQRLATLYFIPGFSDPWNVERAQRASLLLYESVRLSVERRRAEGAAGGDLISRLVRAEFEGRRLDDDEITSFVRSLLPAACEGTRRSFLNTMLLVLERPEVLGRVRADRALVPVAIAEALRYDSTVAHVLRVTTREVEVGGVTIPAQSDVSMSIRSAHRDEQRYEHPDVFDLDRKGPPALAFGFGPHICIGMTMARAEMVGAINALLDLPNLRLDPDVEQPRIRGVLSRSPDALSVVWD